MDAERQIRPTTAHVDLGRLEANYAAVAAAVAAPVLAPVKGDAYGHGLVRCALALEAAGCPSFGVALVEEGIALREAGVCGRILCLGGVGPRGAEAALAHGLTPMVYDLDAAHALDGAASRAGVHLPIHLKVDTGMGRLGVLPGDWEGFLDRLADLRHLEVEGIATHFAEADAADPTFTQEQARRFRRALRAAATRAFRPAMVHASNSAAALGGSDLQFDLVRPGLVLYGLPPRPDLDPGVSPVMRVTTQVLFVKNVPAGQGVSYGRRWVAPRPTRLATLPVGYADGYPRALTNRGHVWIHGHRCPVRGAVCMDLTMVDITDVPTEVRPGDAVELLGDRIRAEELAAAAGTIPYEIVARFSDRVPRTFGART